MFLASLCNLRSFSLKGFRLLNLWPQNLISFPSLNWLKDHIIFSALVSFSRCLKCWFCSYWFRVIKAISEFVLFFHHFSCTLLDFSLLLFCSPPFQLWSRTHGRKDVSYGVKQVYMMLKYCDLLSLKLPCFLFYYSTNSFSSLESLSGKRSLDFLINMCFLFMTHTEGQYNGLFGSVVRSRECAPHTFVSEKISRVWWCCYSAAWFVLSRNQKL